MAKKIGDGSYLCKCRHCGRKYVWRSKWSEVCPECRSEMQRRRWTAARREQSAAECERQDRERRLRAGEGGAAIAKCVEKIPTNFERKCPRCGGSMKGAGSTAKYCKTCRARLQGAGARNARRRQANSVMQAERANAGFLVGECLPTRVEWRGQHQHW